MLHWYFSRLASCSGHAIRLASTKNILMKSLRMAGFRSSTRMSSSYQLFLRSIALRKAVRWLGNRSAGATLSSMSMIFVTLRSGSSRR